MSNKKKQLEKNDASALPNWERVWSEMSAEKQKALVETAPEGWENEWPSMSNEQKVRFSLLRSEFLDFKKDLATKNQSVINDMKADMGRTDAYQLAILELLPPPEDGIGNRIKSRREDLRLNIEELARLTKEYDFAGKKGISPSTLRRYEYKTGGFNPGAREICLLCDALDVSADWLVRGVKRGNVDEPTQEAFNAFLDAVKKIISAQNKLPDSAMQQNKGQRARYIEGPDERLERLRRAKLPEK
jgi:transcriptional regulator with XRE-family HTH domain